MQITPITKPMYLNDSLLVTANLGRYYAISEKQIEFLAKHFSDGITIKEICSKAGSLPLEFLLEGFYHLPLSEADTQDLLKYLKIEESARYYKCHHVKNCKMITESSYCENSKNISQSMEIYDSNVVRSSTDVSQSRYIFDSKNIENSSLLLRSANTIKSMLIFYSDNIYQSQGILHSEKIQNSLMLNYCEEVQNSILCKNISFVNNRILCNEKCEEADYAILNKSISERIFKRVFAELEEIIKDKIQFFVDSILRVNEQPESLQKLFIDSIFNDQNLWTVIKDTIPSYNPGLAYQITLAPPAL